MAHGDRRKRNSLSPWQGESPDRQEDCIVFTHDLDFGALLAASGQSKPSVIQMRCEDTSPATMGAILIQALRLAEEDLRKGALVTVDPRRTRIRVLPLAMR